jgi:C-terminal processing protease CtpA/Prc
MEVVIVADPIGYGMGIQGGASEYSAYPIIISDIAPNGPAGLLGQLSVGDRILSINGVNVCNVSLDHASKLIHEAEDHLQLEIEFDVTESSVVPTSGTFDVNLIKCGFLKLGISIRRSGDRIWIGSLLKGGVAHRSGSLLAGDILLAINGISLVNEREAIALLSAPCDVISLNVKRESVNNFLPSRPSPPKSEPVIYSVELTKNGQSLGISLNGSNVPGQPIVIAGIREGGVAHRTGAIKVNDRIIAINGESLLTKTIQDAQRILQTAGNTVTLKISKGVISRRRKNHQLTRGGATNTRVSCLHYITVQCYHQWD